jgi:hypothetical protein
MTTWSTVCSASRGRYVGSANSMVPRTPPPGPCQCPKNGYRCSQSLSVPVPSVSESEGGELAGAGLDTGVLRHIDPGTVDPSPVRWFSRVIRGDGAWKGGGRARRRPAAR